MEVSSVQVGKVLNRSTRFFVIGCTAVVATIFVWRVIRRNAASSSVDVDLEQLRASWRLVALDREAFAAIVYQKCLSNSMLSSTDSKVVLQYVLNVDEAIKSQKCFGLGVEKSGASSCSPLPDLSVAMLSALRFSLGDSWNSELHRQWAAYLSRSQSS